MLTDEEIKNNKERITNLLKSTKREGVDKLIDFLNKSGYFYAWGSQRHHCYKGGLAEHSLEVYEEAYKSNHECENESIIISALLHDLCKGVYRSKECNKYLGHGSKSVAILTDYLKFPLKPEEWRAIRFHMGFKSKVNPSEETEYETSQNEELSHLIHEADCVSVGGYDGATKSLVKGVMRILKL